jgi:hypothetical protein
MVKFESFSKPISPSGTSLILIYVLYIALSIYSSRSRHSSNDNFLIIATVCLTIPFLMWPLTSNHSFSKEYLPESLKPGENDNSSSGFIKKFVGGYWIAITFPFLKIKSFFFKNGKDSSLKKYDLKNYWDNYVIPILGILILLTGIFMAVYFNENVINATNSVGIYHMSPSQRNTYQIIFSLLIFTLVFLLVPFKMAEALSNTWNFYLVFAFSLINLIILNGQLNDDNVYRKNVISGIYWLTAIILLYSVYNLIFLSDESKDYRILTLGKLSDEDRINISAHIYGVYNTIQTIMADEGGKYFDENGFNPAKLNNDKDKDKDKDKDNSFDHVKLKSRLDENMLNDLKGTSKEGFNNVLKRLDQNFINIYQARLSWEKSIGRWMKDKKDNSIIDGFFESKDFNDLQRSDIEQLRKSAKELRTSWIQNKVIHQLPDSDKTQSVFGVALGSVAGNIALNAASAAILSSVNTDIEEKVGVLLNRYMFKTLSVEFNKVDKAFKDFNIYIVGEEEKGFVPSEISRSKEQINDIKASKEINNFGFEVSDFVENLTNINYTYKNKQIDNLQNVSIFTKYIKIFSGKTDINFIGFSTDCLKYNDNIIFNNLSVYRYKVNYMIAKFNEVMDPGYAFPVAGGVVNVNDRRAIYNYYYDILNELRNTAIDALSIIYSYDNYGDGGNLDPAANDLLSNGGDAGVNILGYVTSVAGEISYKIIKINEPGIALNPANDVRDLKNFLKTNNKKDIINLNLPRIIFDKRFLENNNRDISASFNDNELNDKYIELITNYNLSIDNFYKAFIDIDVNGINKTLDLYSNLYAGDSKIKQMVDNNKDLGVNIESLFTNFKMFIDPAGALTSATDARAAARDAARAGVGAAFAAAVAVADAAFVAATAAAAPGALNKNRDNVIKQIVKTEKDNKTYVFAYDALVNKTKSLFSSGEPIDKDIKLFDINSIYPGEDNLDKINNDIIYEFDGNTDTKKLIVPSELLRILFNILRNKRLKETADYYKLTKGQKNTISKTPRFKRMYNYYFPRADINGSDSVDKLVKELTDIYNSFPDALNIYGKFLNNKENAEKATLVVEQKLINIDKGFPEDIGEGLYRKNDLGREVTIGDITAGENEQMYAGLLESSTTYSKNAIDADREYQKNSEEYDKEKSEINRTKDRIIKNAITNLVNPNGSKEDKTVVIGSGGIKINFRYQTGSTVNLITNKKAYALMTRIYLWSIVYLKGVAPGWTVFNQANADSYLGTDNIKTITSVIISIIIALYSSVLPHGIGPAGYNKIKASIGISDAVPVRAAVMGGPPARAAVPAVIIDSTNNIFENRLGAGAGVTNTARNFQNFINSLHTESELNLNDYKHIDFVEFFTKINNKVQEDLVSMLGNIAQADYGGTPAQKQTAFNEVKALLLEGDSNINLVYRLLLPVISKTNDFARIDQFFNINQINFTNFVNAYKTGENLSGEEINYLTSIISYEYNKILNKEDNKESPASALKQAIVNNPIINSFKIAS